MKVIQKDSNSISIVPETDFEIEHLNNLFSGNEQRKVIVKSGSSLSDIMSIDVIVNNVKMPTTGADEGYPKVSSVPVVPGSLSRIVAIDDEY